MCLYVWVSVCDVCLQYVLCGYVSYTYQAAALVHNEVSESKDVWVGDPFTGQSWWWASKVVREDICKEIIIAIETRLVHIQWTNRGRFLISAHLQNIYSIFKCFLFPYHIVCVVCDISGRKVGLEI